MMREDYAKALFGIGKIITEGSSKSTDFPRIMWRGQEYILVEGAITTPELYAAFEPSIAHLFHDGRILQFGTQVGTKEDITFLEDE